MAVHTFTDAVMMGFKFASRHRTVHLIQMRHVFVIIIVAIFTLFSRISFTLFRCCFLLSWMSLFSTFFCGFFFGFRLVGLRSFLGFALRSFLGFFFWLFLRLFLLFRREVLGFYELKAFFGLCEMSGKLSFHIGD